MENTKKLHTQSNNKKYKSEQFTIKQMNKRWCARNTVNSNRHYLSRNYSDLQRQKRIIPFILFRLLFPSVILLNLFPPYSRFAFLLSFCSIFPPSLFRPLDTQISDACFFEKCNMDGRLQLIHLRVIFL